MKMLVCITKTAEVEVGLNEAKEYLTEHGKDYSDWSDEEIAESFVAMAEDLDPEFDCVITAVTAIPVTAIPEPVKGVWVPEFKPRCKIRGQLAPRTMCGMILVGGDCGFNGGCSHKEAV